MANTGFEWLEECKKCPLNETDYKYTDNNGIERNAEHFCLKDNVEIDYSQKKSFNCIYD